MIRKPYRLRLSAVNQQGRWREVRGREEPQTVTACKQAQYLRMRSMLVRVGSLAEVHRDRWPKLMQL